MKNAFYYILKAFSFSRYFNFYLTFLVIQKKRLYQKDNFKAYDVKTQLKIDCNTHNTPQQTHDVVSTSYRRLIDVEMTCVYWVNISQYLAAGRLAVFKKRLYEKNKCSAAWFKYILIPFNITKNCALSSRNNDQIGHSRHGQRDNLILIEKN